MKRFLCSALILLLAVSCAGCSNKDKEAAAEFDKKIQSAYETVSLGELSQILSLKEEYDALPADQKKYVTNNEMLEDMVSGAKKVAIENSPVGKLSEEDLHGVWRSEETDGSFRGFLYFKTNIYYQANKSDQLTAYDFGSEHLIARSYTFDDYDYDVMGRTGSFYVEPANKDYFFTVYINEDEKLTMEIEGETIGGTYVKTDEPSAAEVSGNDTASDKISTDEKKCIEDGCGKIAEYTIIGFSGEEEYYCEEHYQEMLDIINMLFESVKE